LKLARNYFDRDREVWDWNCDSGVKATFNQGDWTLSEIINGLVQAGLRIERIEEPRGYDIANMDEKAISEISYISNVKSTYEEYVNKFVRVIRMIPFAIIVKARKS